MDLFYFSFLCFIWIVVIGILAIDKETKKKKTVQIENGIIKFDDGNKKNNLHQIPGARPITHSCIFQLLFFNENWF